MYLQSLAHDLRTPLNTVILLNEQLMEQFKEEKMIQSMMRLSISSCQFEILMVDMIQELSKMRVKEFQLCNELFNFRDRLSRLLEKSIVQSELKGLQFNIKIDSRVPKIVHSDPQKIDNILFNLISNSIKYTMKGEINLSVKLRDGV